MKKFLTCVLLITVVFSFFGCDRSYSYSLDIVCHNKNVKFIVDHSFYSSYNFSGRHFNHQFGDYYSRINFADPKSDRSNTKKYEFDIASSIDGTYTLSLELINANKHVVNFVRVALVIDGEYTVYKYYDKNEIIAQKENDPDSILHFNSKSEIFDDVEMNISIGETKEIVIFVWLEEAEIHDENGNRKDNYNDIYNASPVNLRLEIK